MTSTNLKRYELFGWDYEFLNPLTEKEIAWYVKHARRVGGPVLEIACGSGRLLAAIAEAGYDVEGIDLSAGMVKLASERISRLRPEITTRVKLHNADMTDFNLDRLFGLVVIADNSFCELGTREQRLSCLGCVYRHLRSDGKLMVTVRRFKPSEFAGDKRVSGWSEQIHHPVTQDLVRRKVETELMEDGRRMRSTYSYVITHKDGSEVIEEFVSEAPVMLTEDYLALFAEAGFSSNVFVDYKEQADDGESQVICFVCNKLL